MKVKLLLSQSQKQNLPSYEKVVIRGVPFLFNKLKFTLGGKNEPVESELYTRFADATCNLCSYYQ